jgi:hypothetical protein
MLGSLAGMKKSSAAPSENKSLNYTVLKRAQTSSVTKLE